jgi:hypothetical protein
VRVAQAVGLRVFLVVLEMLVQQILEAVHHQGLITLAVQAALAL